MTFRTWKKPILKQVQDDLRVLEKADPETSSG